MLRVLKTWGGGVLALALVGLAPAIADQQVGRPGTVNYTEGNVTLNGTAVTAKELGQIEAAPGQVLQTADGRAEMLLTPGVFMRLGADSALRMDSASLIDTRVSLMKGEAMVEVDLIAKENDIRVADAGTVTRLLKTGIYDFNATQPSVAVYDGQAQVELDDHTVNVGKGERVELASANLKPEKFDLKNTDALYAWSKLRSDYLSGVNTATARTVVANGTSWYGTGWYWNPWFDSWAFLPGAGYLYSPFGYGFYSPGFVYSYYPGYYGGFRGHHGYGGFFNHGGGHRAFGAPAPAGGSGVTFGHGRAMGGFAGGGRAMGGFGGGHAMGGFGGGRAMGGFGGGGGHFGGGRR